VNRDYDLFERLPDGSLMWRAFVTGLENARLKLQDLAKLTKNECFAMHMASKEVVFRENVLLAHQRRSAKRVFQIGYDEGPLVARAELLRLFRYEVTSVLGNEAAKLALRSKEQYDLFILSESAPEETRNEMVRWLKQEYPKVKIVALNAPRHRRLPDADYNVTVNGPEAWLSFVASVVP
jgi:hypothetical protein